MRDYHVRKLGVATLNESLHVVHRAEAIADVFRLELLHDYVSPSVVAALGVEVDGVTEEKLLWSQPFRAVHLHGAATRRGASNRCRLHQFTECINSNFLRDG